TNTTPHACPGAQPHHRDGALDIDAVDFFRITAAVADQSSEMKDAGEVVDLGIRARAIRLGDGAGDGLDPGQAPGPVHLLPLAGPPDQRDGPAGRGAGFNRVREVPSEKPAGASHEPGAIGHATGSRSRIRARRPASTSYAVG